MVPSTNISSFQFENIFSEKNSERKHTEKVLRKKYGLGKPGIDNSSLSALPPGYSDRAEERRQEKGSDNPYEKTHVASVHE